MIDFQSFLFSLFLGSLIRLQGVRLMMRKGGGVARNFYLIVCMMSFMLLGRWGVLDFWTLS